MKWIVSQHKCPDTDRQVIIYDSLMHEMQFGRYEDGTWYSDKYDDLSHNEKWQRQITHWSERPHKPY